MTKSLGMLVAGEITPTETRLALCGLDMGRPVVVFDEVRSNAGVSGLGPMVHQFLTKTRPPHIRGAAFLVPGSVQNGKSVAANLPFSVEAQAIANELGIDRVTLLNDVEAIAHAAQSLTENLLVVTEGDPTDPGNQAVVSAGACPGVAGLFWNGTEHCPFVSEGAHTDFAPSDAAEADLARYLGDQVARVTVELVLSSAGLLFIERYLRDQGGRAEAASARTPSQEDTVDALVRRARDEADPTATRALEMFLAIYGSAAGNVALTLRAAGGIYLAGNVVRLLGATLANGVFAASFTRKAPMQELLRKVPIRAILDERAGILGAASVAARDLRSRRVGGWAS